MNNKTIERLQFITDGIDPEAHIRQTLKVCEGGCKWVQLRIKDFDEDTWLNTALKTKDITDRFNSKLIINDNVDIAVKIGAAGVHLGKNDMSVSEARKLTGEDFIIGGTANTYADAAGAAADGADYVGLGPYRFTATKKRLGPILGIEGYSSIQEKLINEGIKLPVIAIGGIREDDVSLLLKAGLYGVALSSEIAAAADIELKTRILIDKIYNYYN